MGGKIKPWRDGSHKKSGKKISPLRTDESKKKIVPLRISDDEIEDFAVPENDSASPFRYWPDA